MCTIDFIYVLLFIVYRGQQACIRPLDVMRSADGGDACGLLSLCRQFCIVTYLAYGTFCVAQVHMYISENVLCMYFYYIKSTSSVVNAPRGRLVSRRCCLCDSWSAADRNSHTWFDKTLRRFARYGLWPVSMRFSRDRDRRGRRNLDAAIANSTPARQTLCRIVAHQRRQTTSCLCSAGDTACRLNCKCKSYQHQQCMLLCLGLW